MTHLDWSHQSRTKIENVPTSVTEFNCGYNQIKKIENLPPSVTGFYCRGNQIRKIENIPPSVTKFYCGYNRIRKIENLPASLTVFYCYDNLIRKIENLPRALEVFYCGGNHITHVDNLSVTWWNERGGFSIKKYNLITRLQRRLRAIIKIRQRRRAARIIQNGCHNWLWSTTCKDGTMGIVLRLNLKHLREDGLIKD